VLSIFLLKTYIQLFMKRYCIEYFIVPIFVMIGTVLSAQTVAEQDPHWQIDWQDDFHIFNPSVWEAKNNWDHWANYGLPGEQRRKLVYLNAQSNVRVQGGSLILQAPTHVQLFTGIQNSVLCKAKRLVTPLTPTPRGGFKQKIQICCTDWLKPG
jgi:hypothetical protein